MLFVVKHWCESYILGVFDSEAKAQAAISSMGNHAREFEIEEFEINEKKQPVQ